MPIELDNINMIIEYDLIMSKLLPIKLIVMDLDGTVLDNSNNAEDIDQLAELCASLRKLNVMSMVATGRTLSGSKHIIKKLIGHQNIPIITYNGSLIINNKTHETLNQNFISCKSIDEIICINKAYCEVKVLFYYYEEILQYEQVLGWTKGERDKVEFNGQCVIWVDDILELQKEDVLPSAILIDISNSPMKQEIIEKITKIHNISVTASGNKYIEIRPENSDKGNALKIVSNELNIRQDEILAIGDNDNDVEMLDYAGVGISISDASHKAKASSDFITSRGAFEGVLEVLRLIKEFNRIKEKRKDV